jgi:hypothetical protein
LPDKLKRTSGTCNHFFAMQNPPTAEDLQTESDVEQKFIWRILTGRSPFGLNFSPANVFTKPDIRDFEIEKGQAAKRYFPDYIACLIGMPVAVVEAKKPGEDLLAAAREARLYATELNACYPATVNPCQYCVVSDGLNTQLRSWDSDTVIASFRLEEASAIAPAFVNFLNLCGTEGLAPVTEAACRKLRPSRYFRALSLMGGQTVQNELIPPNDFGKVLTANFQALFDPASYEDRQKIVRSAYVESPRKIRYAGEIDRIIRNATPTVAADASLIEDFANPGEVMHHFKELSSLRNKILLLIGSVGSGKSTFVDYLRECVLSEDLREHTAWLRIDLNPAPVVREEIYPWLRRQIIAGIKESSPDIDTACLKGQVRLYRREVEELEAIDGELLGKDSPEFKQRLSARLEQLRQDEPLTIQALERMLCTGRGRLLIIVLDNCDKRNRDEQLLMFQVAKYIQNEIRCLVILPLRHETFENHRHEPPLTPPLKILFLELSHHCFRRY